MYRMEKVASSNEKRSDHRLKRLNCSREKRQIVTKKSEYQASSDAHRISRLQASIAVIDRTINHFVNAFEIESSITIMNIPRFDK